MISLRLFVRRMILVDLAILSIAIVCAHAQSPPAKPVIENKQPSLELVRAVRPWEFACAIGTRSGLLGQESGDFEAWVYPLKIFRNFHLRFKIDGEVIEAKNLARTIQVRPESTTIRYAWDTFSVSETLFAPVNEPGAIIELETDATQSLEIEAVFDRDFQLEWPATMGGSDIEWNSALHAFYMDETQHRFTALVGSPSATVSHTEFSSNYASAHNNSFSLGLTPPGHTNKTIVIAASFQGLPPAEVTYKKLANSYPELLKQSASYYDDYLRSNINIELPDSALQQAYRWAQVSVLQGLVVNPYLGTGLVAGYKDSSDDDQRPGYAWFFGRDALWTSLALNAEGDFATSRAALEFLIKYQKDDGKITHEIAQGASFVPWFSSMPYAYAAADATPLFIVAMEDYVRRSGDIAFAQGKWDSLTRAYNFLVSTYDTNGVPKNEGVGHGWVEGGPLLPVKNELYQASIGLEALKSFADLSHALGKDQQAQKLSEQFEAGKLHLDQAFWMAGPKRFAFALDAKDKQIDTPSVLATVPMWFNLFDEEKAHAMIGQIDGPEIQTAWGMRIIPATNAKYDPAGYHNGSVWPLFTGWASVGEYRYHEPLSAFANLRANALLTFDGSLGHVAEVLSGSYYQTLSSASPHQIWSSAMVIAPLLTGMFGLDTDALNNHVSLAPHLPYDWTYSTLKNVRAGACVVNLRYERTLDGIALRMDRPKDEKCTIDFSPAISLHAHVQGVTLDGQKIPFRLDTNTADQHVFIQVNLKTGSGQPAQRLESSRLVVHVTGDFGLSQQTPLPSLGGTNQGLNVLSQQWSTDRNTLTLETASSATGTYTLHIWNGTEIASVDGATLNKDEHDNSLQITMDSTATNPYPHQNVAIHFKPEKSGIRNSSSKVRRTSD